MNLIEHLTPLKDQWSKPKPKLRFSRHIEPVIMNKTNNRFKYQIRIEDLVNKSIEIH